MSTTKESSVVFSLGEIAKIEEDRIAAEKADAERQKQEATRRQQEAVETATAIERKSRELAEKARYDAALKAKEESARLAAIMQSELEKARLEIQYRANLEMLATEMHHKERIAAISNDDSKKKLKHITAIAVTCLVLVAVIGGYAWNRSSAGKEAEKEALAAQTKATQAELDRLRKELDQRELKVRTLERDLSQATTDADRAKIESQLSKAKKETADTRQKLGRDWGQLPGKPCTCPPGDPMCGCL